MTTYVSDQNRVVFAHESGTYGSGVSVFPAAGSPAVWPGMVTSNAVTEDMGVYEQRFCGTASRNVGLFIDGVINLNGTLSIIPQNWRLLKYILGSCVDAGSPSPYTHTISEVNSNHIDPFNTSNFPSFQVQDAQQSMIAGSGVNVVRTFDGCEVDTFRLTATEGEPLNIEVGYVAHQSTFSSGATWDVTTSTSTPYLFQEAHFYLPSGTSMINIKNLTLNVNNNLASSHYVGTGRQIGEPIPTNRDYEVALSVNGNTTWGKTLYAQYFLGGSTFNCQFSIVKTTGSDEMWWSFSGCKMTDMTLPVESEGVNEWTMTIKPQISDILVTDLTQYHNPW